MSTKFLNIIIAGSIIGIVIISVADIVKPPKKTSELAEKNTYAAQPIPSPSPTPDLRIGCSETPLGDINYKQFTYISRTHDGITLDIFGSNSAKPDSTNEKLVLNLDSKTDSSYVYYLKNKDNDKSNENIYSIECSQEGINGKILGNSVMLLPYKNDIRIGDTWDSTSNLSSASGMSSGPSSLKFDYKVTDVKTIRLLGEERNAITVKVNFRDLNILQYTVVQGVGISEFTIALDLDKFGGYSNQVTLQSAQ